MVSFPSFRILPQQNVDSLNVIFTFSANANVALVSSIEFIAKTCRSGSVPVPTGACSKCSVGFYAMTGGTRCDPCVFGALCAGGQDFPGGVGIYAKPGFWQPLWQREEARRQAMSSFAPTFYSCPFMGACVHNSMCATGYEGVVCAICAPGWQLSGSSCVACLGNSGSSYVLWAFLVAVLVLCVAALWYKQWSRTRRIKVILNKVAQERLVTNIFILLRTRVREFVTVQTVQASAVSSSLHVDPNSTLDSLTRPDNIRIDPNRTLIFKVSLDQMILALLRLNKFSSRIIGYHVAEISEDCGKVCNSLTLETDTLDYESFSTLLLTKGAEGHVSELPGASRYGKEWVYKCARDIVCWRKEPFYTRQEMLLLWLAMLQCNKCEQPVTKNETRIQPIKTNDITVRSNDAQPPDEQMIRMGSPDTIPCHEDTDYLDAKVLLINTIQHFRVS